MPTSIKLVKSFVAWSSLLSSDRIPKHTIGAKIFSDQLSMSSEGI